MHAIPWVVLLSLISGVFTKAEAQIQVQSKPKGGMVVQPGEGAKFIFCNSPELALTLKVDSAQAGATRMSMGTGELAPGTTHGPAQHPGVDEIVYIVRGRGQAGVGTGTVPVGPGSTLYLPDGISHTLTNVSEEPIEFVWIMAPWGVEEGLRQFGVPAGTPCPQPLQQ